MRSNIVDRGTKAERQLQDVRSECMVCRGVRGSHLIHRLQSDYQHRARPLSVELTG